MTDDGGVMAIMVLMDAYNAMREDPERLTAFQRLAREMAPLVERGGELLGVSINSSALAGAVGGLMATTGLEDRPQEGEET